MLKLLREVAEWKNYCQALLRVCRVLLAIHFRSSNKGFDSKHSQ